MKSRILSLLLAAVLLLGLLPAAALGETKTYKGNDVSAPETLIAYVLGDKPVDADKVYAEINKRLSETINATIDWKYLSWSEHGTKYPLLFTSQEDFDLIFTAPTWAHYEEIVGMEGFEPITEEFLAAYAPDLLTIIPQEAWNETKIDGVSYCVPAGEAALRSDVNAVRGDLLEQAGMTDITSFDELLAFFDWVAKHQSETGVSPLGSNTGAFLYEYIARNDLTLLLGMPYDIFYFHDKDSENYTVEYLLDQPWFVQYCKDMKGYFEAGWWSKDSLAAVSTFQENFLQGTSASFRWNVGSVVNFLRDADAAHPEWKVTFVDHQIADDKWVESYCNNDMAINTFSGKKERAAMALNELYGNKEINRLLRYGIEGEHYILVDEGHYSIGPNNGNYATNCPNWAIKNPEYKLELYIENPTAYEQKQIDLEHNVWKQHPAHGLAQFSFDTSNVTTQIALITALKDEYYTPLICGMVDDVDVALQNLKDQLEMAGIRDVLAEAQRQADERKAAN